LLVFGSALLALKSAIIITIYLSLFKKLINGSCFIKPGVEILVLQCLR
jgi:hypothetical protein